MPDFARLLQYLMVITNLEEKQNRKIWVPIRGGNRGGWSLFEWEKVREMPYRDREMYLGNSAKIGVLDKGGKWRKKDWYLHKNHLDSGETLSQQMSEAIKRDQMRMNAALGLADDDEEQNKLTPAEMELLLKKVRGNKEEPIKIEAPASGLGFDKTKIEIRAQPNAKTQNPHRLQGNLEQQPNDLPTTNKQDRSRSRSERRKKKHKKEKHRHEHSQSEQRRERRHRDRSRQAEPRERKKKEKKRRERSHS